MLKPFANLNFDAFYEYHGRKDRGGFSVSKVLTHYEFVNSKSMAGTKTVDQLTGGLRRCLKNHWNDNELVAEALATLMIQQAPWLSISGNSPETTGRNKVLLPVARKFQGAVNTSNPIL